MNGKLDNPDTLMKRVSHLRDVAKFVTDARALTVIQELIAELIAKADSLRQQELH